MLIEKDNNNSTYNNIKELKPKKYIKIIDYFQRVIREMIKRFRD